MTGVLCVLVALGGSGLCLVVAYLFWPWPLACFYYGFMLATAIWLWLGLR